MEKIYVTVLEDGGLDLVATSPIEGATEIEVESAEEVMESPGSFRLTEGKIVADSEKILSTKKREKKEELGRDCEREIVRGFVHNGLEFSHDREAQLNMLTALSLLDKGLLKEAELTARDGEDRVRVTMNKEEVAQLLLASWEHRNRSIDKLRKEDIPHLDSLKETEEIDLLEWR